MRFKYSIYSSIPFLIGGNSLFFLNAENLNSLISNFSIFEGGGNIPSFNLSNFTKNEIKLNNSLNPTTKLEVDLESFKENPLKIRDFEGLKISNTALNERESSESLKTTVNKLVTEIDREVGIKVVEKEQGEQLSKAEQELAKHSNNLKEVLSTLKLSSDLKSRSRERRNTDSQSDISSKKLTKYLRNSLSEYYRQYVELKDKKSQFEKRLINIKEKAKDIKVNQERKDKYLENKVLQALEQIGWNNKDEIDFAKFTNSQYWDGGNNPYGSLLDYPEWVEIIDAYKNTSKEIQARRADPWNRTCSLFAMPVFMSDYCYGNLKTLESRKKLLEKVVPFAVANKLFRDMKLIESKKFML
ncbi:hypothetical protein [Mycoplasma parvum]|uniref:Uncharacterized protein n=1 Tax=Mycoplasma parvum str. Indiana TaxID=1403316 RepID=U5NBN5_9MOLU|nr:hypothetical protein [Mycoplasma parvum]AGX88966.1 hypothetical protein PRV_01005 [Mycoplasma parvum str. Indiana]